MADQTTQTTNPVLAAIASLGGLVAGRAYANNAASGNVPPQLSQLLDMSVQRAQAQNPLLSAATSGMYQMLPDFAKGGPQIPNVPASASASSGGGGMNPWLAGALGAGLGGAAAGGELSKIVDAIRKLFGGGGASIQGNKPLSGGTGLPSYGPSPTSFSGWDPTISSPSGVPYLPSDPGVWYGNTGSGAYPTDPSGGSGVGPGMSDYYNSGGGGSGYEDGSEES